MNKIREIIETKVKVLNEKEKEGSMKILVPWIVAGRMNNNRRLYPLDIVRREVARLQPNVNAGAMISSADHPYSPHTSLANASHIITKLEVGDDGKGWMEAKVLPNEKGKNIMTIIKSGGQLGISARGVGTISPSGTIQKDYKLLGCDIVTNPAEPEAVFDKSNICESLEFEEKEEEEDGDTLADREQAMYELLQVSYAKALDGGFEGDFNFYCELHESGMRKVMHLPEADGKTSVQKLTEEQIKDRTWNYYQESVQGGFRGSFDEWKKAYPKLVEKASEAMKLSEQKAPKPKESFKAKISWSEAQTAGFTGSIDEYRKAYPEMELVLPEPPQKPVTLTIEEEARKIYEGLKKANPNSSLQLEDVKKLLLKEEEEKADKRIRRKAIAIVSRDLNCPVSNEKLKEMVDIEVKALKAERRVRKEKNWQAYKRLLDE